MKLLVVGAGAVGRGFVAPLFATQGATVDFVDVDAALVAALAGRRSYATAMVDAGHYRLVRVPYGRALVPDALTNVGEYDAVFVAAGVRRFLASAPLVSSARVVYVLENVRTAALQLRTASGNPRIRFGIPDVIVSSTAPPELLAIDPLCVMAESGELVLEGGGEWPCAHAGVIRASATDLERRWACKLYIHNASHAILAFLGSLAGYRWVHEAMGNAMIGLIVDGAIRAVTAGVIAAEFADAAFAAHYMERELQRFRNPLLHDPIIRVARDPLRKLGAEDRLMLALDLVTRADGDTSPIITGIAAGVLCHARSEGAGFVRSRQAECLVEVCKLSDERTIRMILDRVASLERESRLGCPPPSRVAA